MYASYCANLSKACTVLQEKCDSEEYFNQIIIVRIIIIICAKNKYMCLLWKQKWVSEIEQHGWCNFNDILRLMLLLQDCNSGFTQQQYCR